MNNFRFKIKPSNTFQPQITSHLLPKNNQVIVFIASRIKSLSLTHSFKWRKKLGKVKAHHLT